MQMLNWGNGIQAGPPAAAELMMKPAGLSPLILQPTGPIVRFTWKLDMVLNRFQCKLCGWQANGMLSIIGRHFNENFPGGQRVFLCTAVLPVDLIEEIQLHKDKKEEEEERKRKHNAAQAKGQKLPKGSGALPNLLKKANSATLDAAILEFLVSCGSAPNIVEHKAFHNMIDVAVEMKTSYNVPNKKVFGLNNYGSDGEHNFGRVLSSELERCKELMQHNMHGLEIQCGTMVSDGAKNKRVN